MNNDTCSTIAQFLAAKPTHDKRLEISAMSMAEHVDLSLDQTLKQAKTEIIDKRASRGYVVKRSHMS
jgi:hypothetical protein